MGLTPSFWRGKRVLVTGHTGFKGAWMCLWLQKLGAEIVGYALAPPTRPNMFEIADVAGPMESVTGDVRDLNTMSRTFERQSPAIVFHMAAQALVRESYRDPVETYSTNVMGTVCLLEAARTCESVKAILVVTSDKCYENKEWPWPYRENDALGGHDPYSSSKACAELITQAYRDSFFAGAHDEQPASVATARAGNVIGGGDWAADRLIPDCIRAFTAGRPVELRSPAAVRPWQHVLDPLAGYLALAERLFTDDSRAFAEAWNFAPPSSDQASVGHVATRCADLWGTSGVVNVQAADALPEAGLLRLDCSKAASGLQYSTRWPLERALNETVAWYKAWHQGSDMRSFTLDQIRQYEQGL